MSNPRNPFVRATRAPELGSGINPYQELYGLVHNPFPPFATTQPLNADERVNGTLYDQRLRAEEEREFEHKFLQIASTDAPLLGIITYEQGAPFSRGQGKSVFLYNLTRKIARAREEGEDALAVYIRPPTRETRRFWQILRQVIEHLAQPIELGNERTQLDEVDTVLRARALAQILPPAQLDTLAALDALAAQELLGDSSRIERELGVTPQRIATTILQLLHDVSGSTLNPIFEELIHQAHGSLVGTWRRLAAWSEIRWARDGAGVFLDGIAVAIIAAGYTRLFIFLDDYERIYLYQNSADRSAFLDTLRYVLFDAPTFATRQRLLRMVTFFHPRTLVDIADLWLRAGLDRLCPLDGPDADRCSVALRALDADQLRALLIFYLDRARTESERNQQRGTLEPFTTEAAQTLIEREQFNVGRVLAGAFAALDAAQRGGRPQVDAALIRSVPVEDRPDILGATGSLSLPEPDIQP